MAKSIDTICLIFSNFEEVHLGKDVFLVPLYLGSVFNLKVNIIFPATNTNQKLPPQYRDVKLMRVKKYNHIKYTLWAMFQLLFRINNNTILMLFHTSLSSAILGVTFKLFKKNSFLYIKCDGEYWVNKLMTQLPKRNFSGILYRIFVKSIDVISIETQKSYDLLCQEKKMFSTFSKISFFPNGFDEKLLIEMGINENKYEQKENIFLVVGRLGSHEKNTELVIEAAKIIRFNSWKIVLVGPLEASFHVFVEHLFDKYPNLKNKVIFTGEIRDKKVLYEWYNRSKVFILPSRREGSAIVLPEAKRFKNYIIATEVGGVIEAVKDGYGTIIPQNDEISLSIKMQEIIDNPSFLKNKYNTCCNTDISYEYLVKKTFNGKFCI